jgi:hypothetical protein
MRHLWQEIQELEWFEICKYFREYHGISADISKHRQHSPPCNPDLKLNSHMAAVGLGLGVNAGLPGIGEEGMM